ncbi:MAG: hypothetical protein J5808_05030 [Paludibacteraceae bacterium]|nr:hypothetical protein [Paludibacteraceae bacterium]
MKKVLKFIALVASVAMFAACSNEEPGADVITTYGGNDSDGDYVTMIVNETQSTYELFYGESKKDENYEAFSNGTFTLKNNGTIMSCADVDGETTFDITVDGKKLKYDNGEEGDDAYSFELKKK